MKLNGITLSGYSVREEKAVFELQGATLSDAVALSGATLTITDDGEVVEVLTGWRVKTTDDRGRILRVTCERDDGEVETSPSAEGSAVAAFARIAVAALSVTDDQAVTMAALYPEWSGASVAYEAETSIVMHGGALWRCTQGHTSQDGWAPGSAPSLWSRIDLAPDGIRIWRLPTCAEDAWDEGDRCHHPGAAGTIYESLSNGNYTEPQSRFWRAVEA
ncbi:carbohydrate-binding protein [Collinsella ihumii]|uniref:Chitin-binding type-3 domain-containing protein n=1 Tax=Collinsella ihumii TaxID=1720204 RepID=A0ABT7XFM9_9ACTN|nr:carbohydrate-binding protein [Collinsella ihumii]MDN0055617.1 hypothetical protein [Collinsella ihumii]MDN0064200.1 hypothetical protein [Collinsella ihumii]